MKPTSIIFIILSIILIASGLGICFIAENMADSNEIALFSQSIDENDNQINKYDLSLMGVTRIALTLKDAEINIYNRASESYIELVNFSKNTYEYSTNGKSVVIDDTVNLLSLFNFASGGFEFGGLRYYLSPDMYKNKDKVVNIYLKSSEEVKKFDIKLIDGELLIADFKKQADYSIDVETGNVTVSGVKTSSEFNVNVKNGDVNLISNIIDECHVTIENGDLYYKVPSYEKHAYLLTTGVGTIYYGGESKGGRLNQYLPTAVTYLTADIGVGDIYISSVGDSQETSETDENTENEAEKNDEDILNNTI